MMKKYNIKKRNKGFTLLELLVVILIIGILAAVALPQYRMAVAKAKYVGLMDLAKSIAYSQERYFMVHNSYTNNFNDLDVDMPQDYTSKATTQYCYDWGGCSILSQNSLYCLNYKINTGIIFYLRHEDFYSSNDRGRSFCVANNTDSSDFSNTLCKQITNKDTNSGSEGFTVCSKPIIGNKYFLGPY